MAEHSQFQAVTNYYEQFTFALSVSPYANILRQFEQVNQLVFDALKLGDKPNTHAEKR